MAADSSHSQPLFVRVGNTEVTVAWLKLPVTSLTQYDAGEPVNEDRPEVVDVDPAAIDQLRRLLRLTPPYAPKKD